MSNKIYFTDAGVAASGDWLTASNLPPGSGAVFTQFVGLPFSYSPRPGWQEWRLSTQFTGAAASGACSVDLYVATKANDGVLNPNNGNDFYDGQMGLYTGGTMVPRDRLRNLRLVGSVVADGMPANEPLVAEGTFFTGFDYLMVLFNNTDMTYGPGIGTSGTVLSVRHAILEEE